MDCSRELNRTLKRTPQYFRSFTKYLGPTACKQFDCKKCKTVTSSILFYVPHVDFCESWLRCDICSGKLLPKPGLTYEGACRVDPAHFIEANMSFLSCEHCSYVTAYEYRLRNHYEALHDYICPYCDPNGISRAVWNSRQLYGTDPPTVEPQVEPPRQLEETQPQAQAQLQEETVSDPLAIGDYQLAMGYEYKGPPPRRRGRAEAGFLVRETHHCIFCRTFVRNFARHLQRAHKTEEDVQEIFSHPIASKERKRLLSVLRKKGDFLINTENCVKPVALRKGGGPGIKYLPCTFCLGFYRARRIWLHMKRCSERTGDVSTANAQRHAQNLLVKDLCIDEDLREKVFPRIRADETSLIAKRDPIICAFGAYFYRKHSSSGNYIVNVTSKKMRELARILEEVSSVRPEFKTLLECLQPENFDVLIQATDKLFKCDPESDTYYTWQLYLHVISSLKICCDLAVVVCRKEGSDDIQDDDIEANMGRTKDLIDSYRSSLKSVPCKKRPGPIDPNPKPLKIPKSDKPPKTRKRGPFHIWTDRQKRLTTEFFANNIVARIPPKKLECLRIVEKYPEAFQGIHWMKIKAFVYNMYAHKPSPLKATRIQSNGLIEKEILGPLERLDLSDPPEPLEPSEHPEPLEPSEHPEPLESLESLEPPEPLILKPLYVVLERLDIKPEADDIESVEPEYVDPRGFESETGVSEDTEPDAAEPEATEPEDTEPEATEPEATEPEASEPEATEPEAIEPFASEPLTSEPEAAESDVAELVNAEPMVEEAEDVDPSFAEHLDAASKFVQPHFLEPLIAGPAVAASVFGQPVVAESSPVKPIILQSLVCTKGSKVWKVLEPSKPSNSDELSEEPQSDSDQEHADPTFVPYVKAEPISPEAYNEESETEEEEEEEERVFDKKPKPKSMVLEKPQRLKRVIVHWTAEQKKLAIEFFASHIKTKTPPKEFECNLLNDTYPGVFQNKDWKKIKVFVQNVYTKKVKK